MRSIRLGVDPTDSDSPNSKYLVSIDAEIERLQNLRNQVAAAVDTDGAITKQTKPVRKGMSAGGRRKIAKAQTARWAKQKKTAKSRAKVPAEKAATKQTAGKKASTTLAK